MFFEQHVYAGLVSVFVAEMSWHLTEGELGLILLLAPNKIL